MGRALKKAYRFTGDVNNEMSFLGKKGIKVYPVVHIGLMKIEINNNGRKVRGSQLYGTNTINDGLIKAIKYVYKKEQENGTKR